MRKLLRILVCWLSFVVRPKKILVFSSFPDFAENPYALYLYLLKHRQYDSYKKVWILSTPNSQHIAAIHETDSKTIISSSTLKNWYYVIIARYIFSSHNAYQYLRFKQQDKLFNLWHGMPLKKIGFDNGETPSTFFGNNFYTLATSPFFVECMSSAFRIPREHVLLTGLPRNDLFFEQSDYFQELVGKHQYSSVGVWMPTFRQTISQDIVDAPMDLDAINYWNPRVLKELDLFLQETNNLLILKLHPADVVQKSTLGEYAHIRILQKENMPSHKLYPLLGQTDYLITDYSSVFIDYLTLNKPIGFLLNDVDIYQKGRPLYFEPTSENLPGTIMYTLDDMKNFIANSKQQAVKDSELLNIFKDNKNSERLVKELDL